MKVVIQKTDLDTSLVAIIMGVTEADEIIVSRGDASEEDIKDPRVLCIEAGGSGLVNLNNFDHHDTDKHLPPACRQAYEHKGLKDAAMERLVEYVCNVDERLNFTPHIEFPSLSNIFSGMLLIEKNPVAQLLKGIRILDKVLQNNINPFGTMPDVDEWLPYRKAKEDNIEKVEKALEETEFYLTKSGLKIGFLESEFIGGIGALYAQDCAVVVMYNPAFGDPPISKYTIASNNKKVSHLIRHFDKIEDGWGGRETIIGSPRTGTMLEKETVLAIVAERL